MPPRAAPARHLPVLKLTLVCALGALHAGCASEAMSSSEDGYYPAPGQPDAGSDVCDCPTGYTCESGVCVPPEKETDRTMTNRPPVASPHYVYALNPTADTVARIDPATLYIEAITVGAKPIELTALPHEDAAVVLSFDDASLSIIDSTTLPSRVLRVPLRRPYGRLAVSPDGAWALASTDPTKPPPSGAEGVVTLIDLRGARLGKPLSEIRFERAAGFRVTDVVYRVEQGAATRAYVFAKQTVSILDLVHPETDLLPARLELPDRMAESIDAREVIATSDGAHVVLRSTTAAELSYFDGGVFRTIALPEVATDIDLTSDGSAAVAALRAAGQLAFIRIPDDLVDPSGIGLVTVGGSAVGQVVLPAVTPPGGSFALVYTNATDDETFARVDLPGGKVTVYEVQKLVDEIDLAPDGASAVIIHRPKPNSSASDPYERAVDQDEGYSTFDVGSGYAQLKRTGKVSPGPFAFSPAGGYVGVALRDDVAKAYSLDAVSLRSLVASTVRLASAPLYMGPVPEAQGSTPHRVFVSQSHAAGRISVVNLDDGQIRTATGFTLNSEIE